MSLQLRKSRDIFIDVKLAAAMLIPHNEPWVLQCNDFLKETTRLVQPAERAFIFIFAGAEAKTYISYDTQCDLLFYILRYKILHGMHIWVLTINKPMPILSTSK